MKRGGGVTLLTVVGVLLAAGTAFGVNSRVLSSSASVALGSASQLLPAEQAGDAGATGQSEAPSGTASEGLDGSVTPAPSGGPEDPSAAPVTAADPAQTTSTDLGASAAPVGAGGPGKVTTLRVGGSSSRPSPSSTPTASPTPRRTHSPEPQQSDHSSASHSDGHGSRTPTPSPTQSDHHDGGGSGSGSGGPSPRPSDD